MYLPTRGQLKSLAYHRVVAARLRADPGLLALARARLAWLRERNPAGRRHHDEWERLLTGPLDELLASMIESSDHGHSLRQENPFMDLVSQRERADIHRGVIRELGGAS